MAVSFVSSFHRCPSVSCQRGVNHVHQLRPISTGHVRQFSVDKRNRTGRSASQCELVIRARSSQARQAPTQSVTKFSKQDAESVRKSLQTLTEANLKDPVIQYLFPSSGDGVNADDLRKQIKDQMDLAKSADLMFHVADFAAAAWCFKIPEELPLKEVSKEPAAGSDSALTDKYKELEKAVNEQLVEFLFAHGPCIKIAYMGTKPDMQGQGLGGSLLTGICKVADAEQQWLYLDASSERSTHLFMRHNFQIVKETPTQPGAPTLYHMGRPPKPDLPSDV